MGQQLALPEASTGWEDSISLCGLYRWCLQSPAVPGKGIVCFVLCNPSTATKSKTDRTTESCLRLARAQGAGQIVLVNLFAYRATHPQDVQRFIEHEGIEKAVGPGNDRHIYDAVRRADRVVVGWGSILKPWSTERGEQLRRAVGDVYKDLWCLGVNRDGAPRHPLYVASGTKLERWL